MVFYLVFVENNNRSNKNKNKNKNKNNTNNKNNNNDNDNDNDNVLTIHRRNNKMFPQNNIFFKWVLDVQRVATGWVGLSQGGTTHPVWRPRGMSRYVEMSSGDTCMGSIRGTILSSCMLIIINPFWIPGYLWTNQYNGMSRLKVAVAQVFRAFRKGMNFGIEVKRAASNLQNWLGRSLAHRPLIPKIVPLKLVGVFNVTH